MLNHFEELCNLCAVSGDEGAVRDYVCRALEGNPTVSWQIDPLGNLLVEKKGAQRAPHHLMVSAHMDEVGLIVTHVQDGGLLEIAAVGGVDASVVIGRQFLVGRQHIPGIVGTKPVHLLSKEQRSQLPTFDGLVLDIGASSAEEARKLAPDMEIHMSTQTGIVNYGTCRALYDMGVTRAVLARELSLEEIAEIRAKIPADMELEVFVHGAMCMSFSGRCLLSAYLTGRDANRGACAQPCRWNYHLMESTRPGQYFPVEETDEGTYIFNAKDLCMIGHLQELLAAGVDSLKIEGRNKSAYYVAIVTNAYRAALDAAKAGEPAPQWALDEVVQVSHREYCTGFFYGRENAAQRYQNSSYVRNCDVVAVVDSWKDGRLYLTQRNRFFAGDTLEIVAPGQPPVTVAAQALQNDAGEIIETANHAMMQCSIACETAFPAGSVVRKPVE